MRSLGFRTLAIAAAGAAISAAAAGGCGGGGTSSSATSSSSSSSSTTTTTSSSSSSGAGGGTSSSSSSSSGAGGGATACTTTATGQLRGSAIALTSDSSRLIAVNRDAGSVTVMSIDYTMPNDPALTEVAEISVGSATSQPWQVVIDGCDETAYVILRNAQQVVEINNLKTTPTMGKSVQVGSEPTSLALTPNNTKLYVSNWVDGNISVIDPTSLAVTSTIDLNATIAATGFLGPDVAAAPRPALAHPRGIAITNNGDGNDADETVYVTEWFAVRTAPEEPGTPLTSDTNWKGLLYKVPVAGGAVATIDLPPVMNTGFNDAKGGTTGCFPNQVGSVTLENEGTMAAPSYFAYVSSTCASPAGPTGVFQKSSCVFDSQCILSNGSTALGAAGSCVNGACILSCTPGAAGDASCGVGSAAGACGANGACAPLAANAKTTTHPGLTIVNLSTSTGVTTNLDASFTSTTLTMSKTASTRMPLLPTDVDFKPGFAYVASEGADALFRLTIANGAITAVGSTASSDFVDLHVGTPANFRLPIGIAISQDVTKPVAFVANDGTRTVTAVNLSVQAVSASATGEVSASAVPAAGSAAASVLNGKRLFTTGLGRWSLNGAAWGSCAACHVDGLTDNVTWYFARGPRQTTSLDGTFGKHPTAGTVDQRILNWTAVNDEIADFEGNVRGISGGVGAIVSTVSTPPANSDRIGLGPTAANSDIPQQGLEGSSAALALTGAAAVSTNWQDITNYVEQIRSPRAATASLFSASDITAGAALFASATCNGCHSGEKWTLSTVFYTPGNVPNDAFGSAASTSLSNTGWNKTLNGFPAALFPSSNATGKQDMRSGAPTAFEQIQCILRPVGTIVAPAAAGGVPTGVSPMGAMGVNVWEVRQDMATGAQGSGNANAAGNDFTQGFNIPSLLGLQVGAPYFHAGNARSLEELFNAMFVGHHNALGAVFSPTPATVKQLVAYLLSIDGSATALALPAGPSAEGGDICHYP
jgi:YVTN family beta-propeller protein